MSGGEGEFRDTLCSYTHSQAPTEDSDWVFAEFKGK